MSAFPSDAPVLVERIGAVARVTLNRPAAANAVDLAMAQALLDAAIACDEDREVRCVLLTGAGRLFCAGGDVAAFPQGADARAAYLKRITGALHAAMLRLVHMDKPLVVAVNGPAAGAGIGLATFGDIVLAAPEAHFTLAYTAIGMSPDAGATWLLPRLVGFRRAQELCLANRRVAAEEAAAIGLVTRVAAPGALADEALTLAGQLAAGATTALAITRRLLWASADASLEAQLDAEGRGIAGQARTRDGEEGVAAFLAKRAPAYHGD